MASRIHKDATHLAQAGKPNYYQKKEKVFVLGARCCTQVKLSSIVVEMFLKKTYFLSGETNPTRCGTAHTREYNRASSQIGNPNCS